MRITLISTTETPEDQGIRTLSSVLKKENHEVNLVFMTLKNGYYGLYSKDILKQLKNVCKGSKLIGINCFINSRLKAFQIIRYLRNELKSTIIFGGIYVTLSPNECIKHNDLLCIGESEEAIIDIARNVNNNQSLNNIKNLWIRTGKKIIKNPVRNLITNLDNIPYPDFDFENHYILDKEIIRKFEERDLCRDILFLSGRGCPYGCSYCSNSTLNELYRCFNNRIPRYHSVDYTINFLKILKSKFKDLFYIDLRDDTFSMRDINQIKEFFEKYKKEINLPFKVYVDAKSITEEKIKIFVESGCTDISLGIQGSERINRDIFHRYIDYNSILKSAKIINKYKNKVCANYDLIVTNPYETEKDLLGLIELIKILPKPFRLYPSNLVFFEGSQLYNMAVKDGTIKSFKDTAISLKYDDRSQHILLKGKNIYLNTILNLMRGIVTENKYGSLSKRNLDYLLNKNMTKRFRDNNSLVYIFPYLLRAYDFMKYGIFKPIYTNMPQILRSYYVKKNYEGKIVNSNIRFGGNEN